jgi:hypothetical protein
MKRSKVSVAIQITDEKISSKIYLLRGKRVMTGF